MKDTPVAPALSSEEWRRALSLPPGVVYGFHESEGSIDRHALAAICLYSTPNGFTQADVDMLLRASMEMFSSSDRDLAESLQSRISSLLPPPTTEPAE